MQPEIYLITPPDADAAFADTLASALVVAPVAAVLIQRGTRDAAAYRAAADALVPLAQQHAAAALLDGDAGLVRDTGADGLHVTAGIEALKRALGALKPNFIVGAGGIRTRHDAMLAGEAGADYVFFGSLGPGPASREAEDMARWWAETVEVPAVWFAGDAGPGEDAPPSEFIALRGSVWDHPDGPAAALRTLSAEAAGAA